MHLNLDNLPILDQYILSVESILNGAHDPLCPVISHWFTLLSDIRLTNG